MYSIAFRAIILLLYIKKSLLIFLQSGINQLSNLIFLQKLSYFILQNNLNKCSISDGPHCYYVEPSYIKSLEKENQTLKKDYVEKNWISLIYDVNQFYSYQDVYDELETKIKNYYEKNIKEKDKEQKVPIQEDQIGITFENYDSITIKNDIYLEKKTFITINSDRIPFIVEGKVRLRYDKSKLIVKNLMDYPSKTYAMIESSRAVISLDGKNFRCLSLFVRPLNRYGEDSKVTIIGSMTKNFVIEGYNNNRIVFSTNYQFSYFDEKHWSKIILSNNLFINRLILPGNLEIDNISLSVESSDAYDIQSLFYSDPKRKVIDLINDNDI